MATASSSVNGITSSKPPTNPSSWRLAVRGRGFLADVTQSREHLGVVNAVDDGAHGNRRLDRLSTRFSLEVCEQGGGVQD
jgi:hypothetical protein